jgi:hypothetical protein
MSAAPEPAICLRWIIVRVGLGKRLGPLRTQHGGGVSPILHDGMVILPNEQDGESSLIGVDARTGETRWKTPRRTGPSSAAYSRLASISEGKENPR